MFKKHQLSDVVLSGDGPRLREMLNRKKEVKKLRDPTNFKERNPVYLAVVVKQDAEMTRAMLDAMVRFKIDVNVTDEGRQTVLHYACNTFKNDPTLIMELLNTPGINVNATNFDEQTPLHIFCSNYRNVQTYKPILEKFHALGADLDFKNRKSETPLMKCIKNNSLRGLIAQYLIDHNADVNTRNATLNTPLHFVVLMNRVDLVMIFVKGGADIYCQNNAGDSPMSLAMKQRNFAVLAKLNQAHNLNRWLSETDPTFVDLYYRKFLGQELHPLVLKSYNQTELDEVLGYISTNPSHIAQLKASLSGFVVTPDQLTETPIQPSPTPPIEHHALRRICSYRNSLPPNMNSLTIQPGDIEFTGETKASNKVGKGSTCNVFRGVLKKTKDKGVEVNIDVAVKVLNDDISLDENDEFTHELEVQKTIRHKNIVHFFGVVVEETLAIVMEFCARFTLYDVMNDPSQQIDWLAALNFARQLCCGLNALHSNTPAILHRDFKSLNVLVSEDYTLKLSDFGLSRFDLPENRRATLKELRGTIPYCCPEIIGVNKEPVAYSVKSDIYSLGITLWEVFRRVVDGAYSKPWFKEYSIPENNDFAILNFIGLGKRPSLEPRDLNEACIHYVPPCIAQLYQQCVSEDPDSRPTAPQLLGIIGELEVDFRANTERWNNFYVPVGFKKM